MRGTGNIYIDALKFSAPQMQSGVSYNEVKNHLESLGWKFSGSFDQSFRLWFHTNFFLDSLTTHLKWGTPAGIMQVIGGLHRHGDVKAMMTADAYEFLKDYEKLVETRESSKQAQKTATWAIWVSVFMGLVQIVLAIVQLAK